MGQAAAKGVSTDPSSTEVASSVDSQILSAAKDAAREKAASRKKPVNTLRRTAPSTVPPPGPAEVPSFMRGMAWNDMDSEFVSPAAFSTQTAAPLPKPPASLLKDPRVKAALDRHPEAIEVKTPFDIDRLAFFLTTHPNRPFVDSVLWGLKNGFWLLSSADWEDEAQLRRNNPRMPDPDLQAIRDYRDAEVAEGRWSQPIPEILPGMKISPMFVVWKNDKARVITDHRASGLNDSIPPERASVRYDGMCDFGQALHNLRQQYPVEEFTLYKSDVSSAFLNLPAHPVWQLHQVVEVDGKYHIVRRLVFGNRASPYIWCAVSSLLCWIAINVFKIPDIFVYMDDFYGVDRKNNEDIFRGQLRPRRQIDLLMFWNLIRCPYSDKKQLDGVQLEIIGFWVDIARGNISISPTKISETVTTIKDFLAASAANRHKSTLLECEELLGWLNWVLNVFPWGKPAVTELSRRMRGKTSPKDLVAIDQDVIQSLNWFKDTMPQAVGVYFLEASRWADRDADLTIYVSATLSKGIAFVYEGKGFIYAIPPNRSNEKVDIIFLKEIAILSAVYRAATLPIPPKRILIFCDDATVVNIFNTLIAGNAMYNAPLMAISSIVSRSGVDVRVKSTKQNVNATLLSRLNRAEYEKRNPGSCVEGIDPPRVLLAKRWRNGF